MGQPLAFSVFLPVVGQRQVLWGYTLSSGTSSCVSLRVASGEFRASLAYVVHTWKFGALYRRGFVSGSLGVARGVQVLDFSGDAAFM